MYSQHGFLMALILAVLMVSVLALPTPNLALGQGNTEDENNYNIYSGTEEEIYAALIKEGVLTEERAQELRQLRGDYNALRDRGANEEELDRFLKAYNFSSSGYGPEVFSVDDMNITCVPSAGPKVKFRIGTGYWYSIWYGAFGTGTVDAATSDTCTGALCYYPSRGANRFGGSWDYNIVDGNNPTQHDAFCG